MQEEGEKASWELRRFASWLITQDHRETTFEGIRTASGSSGVMPPVQIPSAQSKVPMDKEMMRVTTLGFGKFKDIQLGRLRTEQPSYCQWMINMYLEEPEGVDPRMKKAALWLMKVQKDEMDTTTCKRKESEESGSVDWQKVPVPETFDIFTSRSHQ